MIGRFPFLGFAPTVLAAPQSRAVVKPHIRWNRQLREWVCTDRGPIFAYAWGPTREAAYESWLRKFRHAMEDRP